MIWRPTARHRLTLGRPKGRTAGRRRAGSSIDRRRTSPHWRKAGSEANSRKLGVADFVMSIYKIDMTSGPLGELEHLILLALLRLGPDAYGVPIVDEIRRRTGRAVAPAAVYVTLRRLEQKGLLTSWMGDSTPERGGKSRRCVKVTAAGLESLRESRKVLESMWKGLDSKLRSAQ